jgi:integrase/recombinase XerC
MKLIEALEIFLNEYDNPATRETYAAILRRFLNWLGGKEPSEVEELDLVRYVQKLKTTNLAETTVEKHKKTLKTFFYWLERVALIEGRNPVKAVKQRRLVKKVRKDKAMTDEELAKLIDYLKWHPRNHALILFLAQTGCRAGGVSTLRIEDLDLENCRATVTEKGDRTRKVMYNDDCATAIRTWLLKRKPTANDFVFTNKNGSQLTTDMISQTIRRACLTVGIRSLGAHSLRHRMGHKLAEAKFPPPVAASYLGHTSVETTMANYYPNDWENAADALRELIQTPNATQTHTRILNIHRKSSAE